MTDELDGQESEGQISAPVNEEPADQPAPQAEFAAPPAAEAEPEIDASDAQQASEMLDEGAPVSEEELSAGELNDQELEVEARLSDGEFPAAEDVAEESASELSVDQVEDVAIVAEVTRKAPSRERVEDSSSRMVDEEVPNLKDVPLPEGSDGRAWYVVHCYSGYENKVRHNLEQRIESMGMKDKIFDVVVPTEEEIEVKEGKRRTVERRVFPGYILVNMILGEESWYVVRNTPGVTSFVGQGNTPLPLRPEEVSQIVKRMEAEAPRIKVTFRQGERVRIVDGPFNDFRGTVSEIDMERAKVRVMVNFFGRETPVELDFLQVEKA
jgi:transcriptional antiterminator NusG